MPSPPTEDFMSPGQVFPESLNNGNLWPLMNMNIPVPSTPSHASTAPTMINYGAASNAPLQALYEAFHNPVSNSDVQLPSFHVGHAFHTTPLLEMSPQGRDPAQNARQTVATPNNTEIMPASMNTTALTPAQTSTLPQGTENAIYQTFAANEIDSVTSNNLHASLLDSPHVITTAEDLKPLLKERLPREQSGKSYRGYIRGAADFAAQSLLYESLSHKAPGSAVDFPQDDAGLIVLAKGLAEAMMDMSDTVEAGKKPVTRINQLSPYEIELKSWKLLYILRDVQLGRVDLHLWGAEWNMEIFETFMDRYEDVRANLRTSKSLVSSLFDQEFGVRLALAPGSELKKKLANSKNNSRRAIELAGVRNQKKRALESSQADEDDDREEKTREKRPHTEEPTTTNPTDMPPHAVANPLPQSGASTISGYNNIQLEDFHVDLDLDHDYAS